jgi:hypothetical protein
MVNRLDRQLNLLNVIEAVTKRVPGFSSRRIGA